MNLCKRVIARLDVKGTRLIKGINFEGLRVLGDACSIAKKYAEQGVDEIFYSDAVASLYGRNSLVEVLKATTKNVFVPITAGGAIRSVEDGRKLLAAGADKLAINTAAVNDPSLITNLALKFGRQCVVASIQARKSINSDNWDVMIESGRERSGLDILEWIEKLQELGAGEILITSVDRDGTQSGPDYELYKRVYPLIKVPFIFGGGFSTVKDVNKIININPNFSAISLGSSLHYEKLFLKDVKATYQDNRQQIRPLINNNEELPSLKRNYKIAIIDYQMGNVQSLINAIDNIGGYSILTNKPQETDADLWILPGVGTFPQGIMQLQKLNLIKLIQQRHKNSLPILGICLGMQLFFHKGTENSDTNGLSLFPGEVQRLPVTKISEQDMSWPHVGWNKIETTTLKNSVFNNYDSIYQYFVHGYASPSVNKLKENILFKTNYGLHEFVSGIVKNRTIGLQFHPERSGKMGLRLLVDIIESICV